MSYQNIRWATDNNYVAPGKSWDGQPTKTNPLASKKEQGWYPLDSPPAQYWNWWKNQIAAHVEIHRNYDILNWRALDPDQNPGVTPLIAQVAMCRPTDVQVLSANAATFIMVGVDTGGNESIRVSNDWYGANFKVPTFTPAVGLLYGVDTDIVNGIHVAVGASGTAQRSTNDTGLTWVQQAIGATGWRCIGDDRTGLWAIGGTAGKIYTSPDGITWTARTSGVAVTINAIQYGGTGIWVAGTADGRILTSPDGITWTIQATIGTTIEDITYDPTYNLWIAVGNSLGVGYIATANDPTAVSWNDPISSFPVPAFIMRTVTADINGRILAFGSDFTTSNDGEYWFTIGDDPDDQIWFMQRRGFLDIPFRIRSSILGSAVSGQLTQAGVVTPGAFLTFGNTI